MYRCTWIRNTFQERQLNCKMNGPLVFVLCVFVASSLFVSEVTSECCSPRGGSIMCEDDTVATPCCGYGPCNIFCCNCDNGCRKAGRMGESVSDGFLEIDSNLDGKVSLDEAKAHIASGRCGSGDNLPKALEEFARMDLDQDGFLSREEIDPVSKV